MIGKIRKATTGKPCSCPDGKQCWGCKKKINVKPQVYIEEPRRLTIPIVVSHYKAKSRRWSLRKDESVNKPVLKTTLCQWYKRRKALNDLKRIQKRERQERIDQARREREIEYLEQLRREQAEYPVVKETTVKEKEKKPYVKQQKPKRVKARTTTAKPLANSKFVTVKQNNRYDAISERFVNCCYRACCQFYCYISCILIVGFVLIYFL